MTTTCARELCTKRRTGFAADRQCALHRPGPGHPERPERLESALAGLRAQPWFDELVTVAITPADRETLETVHSPRHVNRAREACESEAAYLDVPDVGVCADSFEAARLAAGAGLALAEKIIAGEIDNGFALVRPPGHHAEREMALGFCLFNNVAILARVLRSRHGLEKIAILDWDVHYGNGTAHAFERDPSVLYLSLHQYPHYPGTGAASETGEGPGLGATVNCPLPAGSGNEDYERAFRERVLPAMDRFAPDAVLLSAGFDAHRADPLGDIRLSTEFYGWMTERALEVADRHAEGRLISLLEGGYDLAALADSVGTHVATLSGVEPAK